MHDEIIRYELEGEVADSELVETKERLTRFLEMRMRDSGAVPSLDINPQWSLNYKPETETYDFKISVYGVYVGEGETKSVAGVSDGMRMKNTTPKSKSSQSLEPVE